MVSLTPIQLSQEEHDRITALKHQLKAKSWKDMLMKLCDICEGKQELPTPFQTTEKYIENLIEEKLEQKPENRKEEEEQKPEGTLSNLLKKLGKKKA